MKLVTLSSLALTVAAIFSSVVAHATPITFSASALASITVTPSSDTLTLDTTSIIFAGPGNFAFQTGNILIGDSEIANQIIPFSFTDTITINGITRRHHLRTG